MAAAAGGGERAPSPTPQQGPSLSLQPVTAYTGIININGRNYRWTYQSGGPPGTAGKAEEVRQRELDQELKTLFQQTVGTQALQPQQVLHIEEHQYMLITPGAASAPTPKDATAQLQQIGTLCNQAFDQIHKDQSPAAPLSNHQVVPQTPSEVDSLRQEITHLQQELQKISARAEPTASNESQILSQMLQHQKELNAQMMHLMEGLVIKPPPRESEFEQTRTQQQIPQIIQQKLEAIEKQLQSLEQSLSTLSSVRSSSTSSPVSATDELLAIKQQIEQFRQSVPLSIDPVLKLQEQLTSNLLELKTLKEQYEKAQQDRISQKTLTAEESSQLNIQKQEIETNLKQKTEANEQLLLSLREIREKSGEKQKLFDTIFELNQALNQVNDTLSKNLEELTASYQQKIEELNEKIRTSEQELAKKPEQQSVIDSLHQEIEQLKAAQQREISSAKQESSEQSELLIQRAAELVTLQQQLGEKSNALEQLRKTLESAKQQRHDQITRETQTIAGPKTEDISPAGAVSQTPIDIKEECKIKIINHVSNLEKDQQRYQEALKAVQAKLERQTKRVRSLESKYNKIQQQRSNLRKLEDAWEKETKDKSTLEKKLKSARSALIGSGKKEESLKQKIEELSLSIEKLQNDYKESSKQLEITSTQIQEAHSLLTIMTEQIARQVNVETHQLAQAIQSDDHSAVTQLSARLSSSQLPVISPDQISIDLVDSNIDDLTAEIQSSNETIIQLQQQIDEQLRQISESEATNIDLRTQVTEQQRIIDEKNLDILNKSIKLATLSESEQKILQQLKETERQLTQALANQSFPKESTDVLGDRLQQLEQRNANLRKTVDELQMRLQEGIRKPTSQPGASAQAQYKHATITAEETAALISLEILEGLPNVGTEDAALETARKAFYGTEVKEAEAQKQRKKEKREALYSELDTAQDYEIYLLTQAQTIENKLKALDSNSGNLNYDELQKLVDALDLDITIDNKDRATIKKEIETGIAQLNSATSQSLSQRIASIFDNQRVNLRKAREDLEARLPLSLKGRVNKPQYLGTTLATAHKLQEKINKTFILIKSSQVKD